jgi:hypothetical protein
MEQSVDGVHGESRRSGSSGRRRRRSRQKGFSAQVRARRYKKVLYTTLFILLGGAATVWIAIRLGSGN